MIAQRVAMSNKMQNTDEFLGDLLQSAKFDAIPAKYDGMSQDEYREVVVKAISERIAADYVLKENSSAYHDGYRDGRLAALTPQVSEGEKPK
jgi:hypothetical protein